MTGYDPIYAHVRAIPRGQVSSYSDVGAAVHAGAREVGRAMASVPADVPWHRVVGADGGLRIAARDPHLAQLQRQLLESEGVEFDSRRRVEPRFFVVWEGER